MNVYGKWRLDQLVELLPTFAGCRTFEDSIGFVFVAAGELFFPGVEVDFLIEGLADDAEHEGLGEGPGNLEVGLGGVFTKDGSGEAGLVVELRVAGPEVLTQFHTFFRVDNVGCTTVEPRVMA